VAKKILAGYHTVVRTPKTFNVKRGATVLLASKGLVDNYFELFYCSFAKNQN